MDIPRGLLTKLIDEDRLNDVIRSGVTPESLENEECQSVFTFVARHYSEYKQVPSRTAVKNAFPNFEFAEYKEPLSYFIEEHKEIYRRKVLEDTLLAANRTYLTDTKQTEHALREGLKDLALTQRSFKDVDLAQSAAERIEAYNYRADNPGADGILTNWPKIDYLTLGFHAEEFIVLVGEKYIGKSWVTLWLAYQAMLQGERVLVVTKEMSQDAMARRFDSIYAGVKFDSLRRGELSDVEKTRYEAELTKLSNSSHRFTIARNGVDTIEEIQAKAIEVDATIVFIDSVYLFNPDGKSWGNQGEVQRRIAISQRCKNTAKTLGIPVVVSTQAGRKKNKSDGADLDRIEWSNAFSQDADTVLFLDKDDVDRELNRAWIHILKSRDGDIGSCAIHTDFEYMKFGEDGAAAPEPTTEIDLDEDETVWNA